MQELTEKEKKKLIVRYYQGEMNVEPYFSDKPLLQFIAIARNINDLQRLSELKQEVEKVRELVGELSDRERRYNYEDIYCVNVKRSDYYDTEDLVNTIEFQMGGLSEDEKESVEGVIEDPNTWYWWIDSEREHVCEILKFPEDYGYPELKEHIWAIGVSSAGFYGRSGGWFGFKSEMYLEDALEEQDDAVQSMENPGDGITYFDWLDQTKEDLKEITGCVKSVLFILDCVDNYNKSLSYRDEVIYRCTEKVDEMRAEARVIREKIEANQMVLRFAV